MPPQVRQRPTMLPRVGPAFLCSQIACVLRAQRVHQRYELLWRHLLRGGARMLRREDALGRLLRSRSALRSRTMRGIARLNLIRDQTGSTGGRTGSHFSVPVDGGFDLHSVRARRR